MYDHILVPTDGSEGNEQTIAEAIDLAGLTGATIHGLYVIDTRDYSTLPESKWITLEEELQSAGERALDEIRESGGEAGVDVTTNITRGIPHERIVEYADENDIDLVIMGTHGRTGLNRFLIGSVTEKVIRSSSVPVLVLRIQQSSEE
ncbi:MAG: universal stress protein [Halodesulfurarchaeum sp.]